jgi:hypothetical protein
MKSPAPRTRKAAAPKSTRAAGISDEAVRRATGQGWQEWFRRLDALGARELDHQSIAVKLREEHRLSGWWSQNVTGEYERAHGRRVRNQTCDGSFSANTSMTIAVPVAKLYGAWADARQRAKWLPNAPLKITTTSKNKSMRIAWDGGSTRLSVSFLSKGAGKSQVSVGHDNLPNLTAVRKSKAYWRAALERLKVELND